MKAVLTMAKSVAEVEKLVHDEVERVKALKPIRNLDIMLMLTCVICGSRCYAQALNPQAARDLALAGGWGFITDAPPQPVCPYHNPAQRMKEKAA